MAGREAEKILRPWDFGKKGYRQPGEPADERPIMRGSPFWEDAAEQEAYERAVRERPIRFEGVLDYLQGIVKQATGKDIIPEAGQSMPQVRVPGEEG